jgi:hypothetical protein
MFTYRKFRVENNDHFEEQKYPEIDEALKAIALQWCDVFVAPGPTMLLSFVKDHSISSKSVDSHPVLANLITSKELPIGALEDLFEASKTNPTFQKELQSHIAAYLNKSAQTYSPTKPII